MGKSEPGTRSGLAWAGQLLESIRWTGRPSEVTCRRRRGRQDTEVWRTEARQVGRTHMDTQTQKLSESKTTAVGSMWSPVQPFWHHLVTCWKCTLSDTPPPPLHLGQIESGTLGIVAKPCR